MTKYEIRNTKGQLIGFWKTDLSVRHSMDTHFVVRAMPRLKLVVSDISALDDTIKVRDLIFRLEYISWKDGSRTPYFEYAGPKSHLRGIKGVTTVRA